MSVIGPGDRAVSGAREACLDCLPIAYTFFSKCLSPSGGWRASPIHRAWRGGAQSSGQSCELFFLFFRGHFCVKKKKKFVNFLRTCGQRASSEIREKMRLPEAHRTTPEASMETTIWGHRGVWRRGEVVCARCANARFSFFFFSAKPPAAFVKTPPQRPRPRQWGQAGWKTHSRANRACVHALGAHRSGFWSNFSQKKKKNGAAQRRAGCTSWRGQVRVMRVRILPHGWTGISYGTDSQQS